MRANRLQLLAAATAAALASLVASTSAWAVPGWTSPVAVESTPLGANDPDIVARPGGCTTVVFDRNFVYAATRPPGGPFETPRKMEQLAPVEEVDAAGRGAMAAAAWPDGSRVRLATAEHCDPMDASSEVSGGYNFVTEPTVDVDSVGTAIVAFGAGSSGNRTIYFSEKPPGGPPSEVDLLEVPTGSEGFRPDVATNGEGDAGIVFELVDEGKLHAYGSLRVAPSTWTTPVMLNDEEEPIAPGTVRAAMGPDGSLHAVWKDAGGKDVMFGTQDATGVSEPESLITAANSVEDPVIAADEDGRIAVAWIVIGGTGIRSIRAKYREPESEDFSEQRDVSLKTAEHRDGPLVAIDRDGRTVVTWWMGALMARTMASTRLAGSDFFVGEVPISDPTESVQPSGVSSDADGNTVVALREITGTAEAEVAVFDAAAPFLSDVAIPATGVAGTPIPFSVSPLDAWSSTEPAEWQFGDGTSADGDSTSHTYGAAGTYPVEVSVADEFGNESQASGTTAISPLPPTPDADSRGKGKGGGDKAGPAPRLGRLVLSRKRFRASSRRPTASATSSRRRTPIGTRVSYRLSEPAAVRFVVHRKLPGLRARVRGQVRCVKPSKRLRQRGAKRCVRLRRRGAFRQAGNSGRNRFLFNGWLGRKKLGPGRYRLRAVAIDADGKRSAPRVAGFVISRR